jgi:NitT/TauT family transport system permease protein
MNRSLERIWGSGASFLERTRRVDWVDLILMLALAGFLFGIVRVAREFTGVLRPEVQIDLSPWALPKYTFFSLCRGLLAYIISLFFTLAYGYWAAKDRAARRVLIPLLDIMQSIPVLGFMPGLILALIALFPHSNIGLELTAVLMIFTGQAWNMTFSFYHSVVSLPAPQLEAARVYRFSKWQVFRWVELPSATMGLVWNSMMSMAGGWFFLMISESFVLGDRDFRLPGIGSYMSVAVAKGDGVAMMWAVIAMVLMIVALDQLLWRPVVVWAQKFRIEDSSQTDAPTSWFLTFYRRSRLVGWFEETFASMKEKLKASRRRSAGPSLPPPIGGKKKSSLVSIITLTLLLAALAFGGVKLISLFPRLDLHQWLAIGLATGATLARVLLAVILGTLWALPAGLAIGLSPKLSRILQPVVQVMASFPAPMLFPAAIALMTWLHITLGWGSVVLMLLGTQWYILFNVIAGAMAVPADLREAARSYHFSRWERFRHVYLPAVFPYLVTGWVTAAGGAWNASIVAEYVTYKGGVITTTGVGALISKAASEADFPMLAAAVLTMAVLVVVFNRTVWQKMYRTAQARFSLGS